ncbi:dephospho-CoA kinase [Entomomonas asaccharolytica]|uniref:Dephospho-CoA kinase n=1 Tax=Entomomonas asaccharolytica TaxID=2785331 RepID=A0A974NH16_9GAMM|nr:dephospho-CoA kinase [Entomomonas asaccharolytica]QQP86423.1 dephospho-CoA kinase [Entomomonas asaccharolytica]
MKSWTLGITGGIGSGKTAVTQLFVDKGIEAIDADQAARWVVSKGKPALTKIEQHFGSEILLADGNLNRALLRQQIFQNPQQRKWLENLLHPIIRQEICQFLENSSSPYNILVSPLLIESKQYELVNRVLVIDTSESIQISRSMQRDNNSEQQIKAIMQTQLSRNERLHYADDIIVNDQDISHLEQQVEQLHQFYLTLCKN